MHLKIKAFWKSSRRFAGRPLEVRFFYSFSSLLQENVLSCIKMSLISNVLFRNFQQRHILYLTSRFAEMFCAGNFLEYLVGMVLSAKGKQQLLQ